MEENKIAFLWLITIDGKEIEISYPEDIFDDIIQEVREAINGNLIYCPSDWVDFEIKFCGVIINEIDMKKIIGVRW